VVVVPWYSRARVRVQKVEEGGGSDFFLERNGGEKKWVGLGGGGKRGVVVFVEKEKAGK